MTSDFQSGKGPGVGIYNMSHSSRTYADSLPRPPVKPSVVPFLHFPHKTLESEWHGSTTDQLSLAHFIIYSISGFQKPKISTCRHPTLSFSRYSLVLQLSFSAESENDAISPSNDLCLRQQADNRRVTALASFLSKSTTFSASFFRLRINLSLILDPSHDSS